VPASDCRALQEQVRELHRLFGKKTLEAELLKEALQGVAAARRSQDRLLLRGPLPSRSGSR
jgi:transposase